MKSRNFLLCISLVYLLACSKEQGKKDISAFYFPVDALRGGKVYEFEAMKGDSSSSEYWYLRSFRRDSGMFLTGTYYDHQFQIEQIVREKMTDLGAITVDYSLYETDQERDTLMRSAALIEKSFVFPFKIKDTTTTVQFSLNYHTPLDTTLRVYLTRTRRYAGAADEFEFQGDKYPCIRFLLKETIGFERGKEPEVTGKGEEWYAEGLGLVYYRKTYGADALVQYEYRLKDIFSMAELEERALGKR